MWFGFSNHTISKSHCSVTWILQCILITLLWKTTWCISYITLVNSCDRNSPFTSFSLSVECFRKPYHTRASLSCDMVSKNTVTLKYMKGLIHITLTDKCDIYNTMLAISVVWFGYIKKSKSHHSVIWNYCDLRIQITLFWSK